MAGMDREVAGEKGEKEGVFEVMDHDLPVALGKVRGRTGQPIELGQHWRGTAGKTKGESTVRLVYQGKE